MEWLVLLSNKANTEIASADLPNIRLFSVKQKVSGEPLRDVEGS
jgi:hypothetical protein